MVKVLMAFGGICVAGALFAILWTLLMVGIIFVNLH